MIALLQRVKSARVEVAGETVAVIGAGLLVPQFTFSADTARGLRPSFTPAAPPKEGLRLFEELLRAARAAYRRVASGRFGAEMDIGLVNHGPGTFWLRRAGAWLILPQHQAHALWPAPTAHCQCEKVNNIKML